MAAIAKKITTACTGLLLCSVASFAIAQQSESPPEIEFVKPDNVTNQIPYFDHRFRIDAELEEVTLLFYRRTGAPPIILVRPDGSKLKIQNVPRDKVEWYDDRTFDLIKIKKPMPGPWQAIGDILPNSQIMVVSDVKIEVDPLPEIVLSGETLKVTGKLYNGDKAIDTPAFKDVVTLDVAFFSTNNSAYDNFGAVPVSVTSFVDDGHDLDEYANDGIFTGEFALNFAAGEWIPVYQVKLPMAIRELRQTPIILQKPPVTITVQKAGAEGQFHKLSLNIDESNVDPDSMIFQGLVTLPDKTDVEFSIIEGAGKVRIQDIAYTEAGVHRVKVNAYGKTTQGREFRLVVPEFTFNVDHNVSEFLEELDNKAVEDVAEQTLKRMEENAKQLEHELELAKLEQEQKQQQMYVIIAAGNGVIILVAVIGFFVYRWRKNKVAAKQE